MAEVSLVIDVLIEFDLQGWFALAERAEEAFLADAHPVIWFAIDGDVCLKPGEWRGKRLVHAAWTHEIAKVTPLSAQRVPIIIIDVNLDAEEMLAFEIGTPNLFFGYGHILSHSDTGIGRRLR